LAARASDRPRVRVAAIIIIDDSIVLVRQRRTAAPYYLLPGGGVDTGETLANALVREVAEETGLQCTPVRPIFINDTISPARDRHLVNITFLTEVTGGSILDQPLDTSIEAVEVVPISRLTELDFRPAIARQIQDAYATGFTAPTSYLGSIWTPETGHQS
jgi:8-oxo-dGTP pyrophosphatase MutT (NUDIX family)